MGERGPAPKPTVLKKLEGNPGKRALPKNEPEFPIGAECPEWLPEDAKLEWRRVAPELERIGLLTKVDTSALASYCLAWARLKAAQAMIEDEGSVVSTGTGYKAPHPAVTIANQSLAAIHRFCREFGMTPSSRSRMSLPGESPEADPMEKLLGLRVV